MSAGSESSIDPHHVVEVSRHILDTKSRDLAIAGFLTWGLWRTQGFPGLLEGVSAVEIILSEYWTTLFPPAARMAGRKNAIEWLNLRVGEQVESGAASQPASWELLNELTEKLKSLGELINERFAGDAPIISGITRPVAEKFRQTKPPAQPGEAGAGTAGGTALPSAFGSDEQATEAIRLVGDYFASNDALSRAAFRLQRVARWDSLEGEPPSERGQTLLPPPRDNLRLQLDSAVSGGSWNELLELCRGTFDEDACHFWLDLQRYTVKALEQIGQEADSLRIALLRDLATLLDRLPGLTGLSFSDGTAFADSQTRKWIDETVLPSLASGSGSRSAPIDEGLAEHFDAARSLARSGKLSESLRLLQQGLDGDGKARSRMLRRLEIAQVLIDSGQPSASVPILEALAVEVDAHGLADWDRELSSRILSNLLVALRAESTAGMGAETLYQRIAEVKQKLSVIDIETALAHG